MRKFLALAVLIALCLGAAGCTSQRPVSEGEGIDIVTTVFPAYDFARQIAGERARVTLLVPPGSESHSFEPTPQDVIRIESCALLFCNGGESEVWLEQILEGRDKDIPKLSMLSCVSALEEELTEGMQAVYEAREAEGDEGPEYDEHVWTSPVNARLICEQLCEILCGIDPEGAEYYRANLSSYSAKLNALDMAFRELVRNAGRDTLIFADRFPVRYFVEEYGLKYYAAFPGCADDAEPSARTVAFLIDKVRQESIPAVFYIEFSNEKMADVICEDTGCEKLLFHSCHNVSARELQDGVSYLELMQNNLVSLEEALGGWPF